MLSIRNSQIECKFIGINDLNNVLQSIAKESLKNQKTKYSYNTMSNHHKVCVQIARKYIASNA